MSEYRGIRLNTWFKVICNGAGAKMARCFNVIAGFCNCFRLAGQNIHVEHLFKKLNVCLSILLRPQWVSHKELLPIKDWKLRCSLALLSTFLWRQLMHYFCPESKVVHTLQNSANWCTISGKATYNHHCSFLVLCRALVIFQVTVMSRLFQSKSVLMALAKNRIPCSKQKRLWKLKNEIRNSAFDKFAFLLNIVCLNQIKYLETNHTKPLMQFACWNHRANVNPPALRQIYLLKPTTSGNAIGEVMRQTKHFFYFERMILGPALLSTEQIPKLFGKFPSGIFIIIYRFAMASVQW